MKCQTHLKIKILVSCVKQSKWMKQRTRENSSKKKEENKWSQNEYQSEGERVIHAAHSKAGDVRRDIHATRSLSDEVVTRLMAVSAISPHITSSSSSIGWRFFVSSQTQKEENDPHNLELSSLYLFLTPQKKTKGFERSFFLQMDHTLQMESYSPQEFT